MLIPTAVNGRHAISLDLFGGDEPSEATYGRLERDLRDQLVVLRSYAERTQELYRTKASSQTMLDAAGDLAELRRALDVVATWWIASQGPLGELADDDQSVEAQLGRAISVAHVRRFCTSDAEAAQADEYLVVVVRSFFIYGANDFDEERSTLPSAIPVLGEADSGRVVRATEYLLNRLAA